MLRSKLTKKDQGFTIIEVLIVLAIAGLILLIVFLAVPALQRNSRNTQYRSEATRLLSTTSEFVNNNGGALPAASVNTTSPPNDASKVFALANTKNITTLTIVASGTVTAQSPTLTNAILVSGGVKCGAQGGASVTPTVTGASARSIVLIYAVENADGSVNAQCTES